MSISKLIMVFILVCGVLLSVNGCSHNKDFTRVNNKLEAIHTEQKAEFDSLSGISKIMNDNLLQMKKEMAIQHRDIMNKMSVIKKNTTKKINSSDKIPSLFTPKDDKDKKMKWGL